MLDGYRLVGGDRWKPDVEPRPNPGSAGYRNCPVVFLNDFTNRREPEAAAVGTRRKERLAKILPRPLLHGRARDLRSIGSRTDQARCQYPRQATLPLPPELQSESRCDLAYP